VPSKLASDMPNDDWTLHRQIVPIRTEVTTLVEGADNDVVRVD
jgi:hypothetical protein